jgi:hypothetical protein
VHEPAAAGQELDGLPGELVLVLGHGGGGRECAGEAYGGGGVPTVPDVRDAVRGGAAAQVPPVQEPGAAALPPRRRRQQQEVGVRQQALANSFVVARSVVC